MNKKENETNNVGIITKKKKKRQAEKEKEASNE